MPPYTTPSQPGAGEAVLVPGEWQARTLANDALRRQSVRLLP